MKKIKFALVLIVPLGAQAYEGNQYQKMAKISVEKVRSIAHQIHPGEIVKEKLGYVEGVLCYTFYISAHKRVQKVVVDAESGVVRENPPEF